MKVNCLIVDDEKLAREGLKIYLNNHPEVMILGEAKNLNDAVDKIKKYKPNLVFLDINMPNGSGLEIYEKLDDELVPYIIFITAYDEFAIKGFDHKAIDYLLKPVEQDRLFEALNRFLTKIENDQLLNFQKKVNDLLTHKTTIKEKNLNYFLDSISCDLKPKICIQDGVNFRNVKMLEVEYIKAVGDYMNIVMINGESYMYRITLKELLEKLEKKIFFQIHRSTIVNILHIENIQSLGNSLFKIEFATKSTVKSSKFYLHNIHRIKKIFLNN